MSYYHNDSWFGEFVMYTILLFCVIGLPLIGACNKSAVSRECLRLGYRDSQVTWAGFGREKYCILRQDQTDTVVPLDEARRNPIPRVRP